MNRISYSQLSMYNECPLRWKLNYVDDLSIRESNIHLIFGTAMHEVLQKYLEVMYHDSAKNADLLDLNEMLNIQTKLLHEEIDKLCEETNKELLTEGLLKKGSQYFQKFK